MFVLRLLNFNKTIAQVVVGIKYEHQMHSSTPEQPREQMNEFPVFMNITQNTSNTSQYNKATK